MKDRKALKAGSVGAYFEGAATSLRSSMRPRMRMSNQTMGGV